jgi:putative heme-binding domain-containing protein
MPALKLLGLALFCFFASLAAAEDFPHVVETEPLAPEEQLKKFHLPRGFEIQLVAAEPDVRKPINLAFDTAGRLYFSQSIEYPYAAKPDVTPRDTVRRIEGLDSNGRATKVSVAVDQLNIPIGVLPLKQGELLVYSIPNIYKCFDADGDGKYEKREVFLGPFDNRDTHGMNNNFVRGMDGWIYACHGFANDSRVKGRDGHEVHMNSGNVYRFRPDGSRIEFFTHGQVNPFGLAFDQFGNLFSTDCHTLPAYQLIRGAYYDSFGKPHDGLGYGPAMMSHSHGSTGLAGIVYYAADHFPSEYRDTLFIGNPITHRVNHDKLEWAGSTPKAIEQPDFVRCDDPWFRPVDLELGPDGALYIADFYNCIIGHYEVPLGHPKRDRTRGRIWRVVYKGTPDKPVAAPSLKDLTNLDLDGLIARLDDPNLVVRTSATQEILDRFRDEAIAKIASKLDSLTANQRAHAAYILAQPGKMDEDFLRLLRKDDDAIVRAHAVRALAGVATTDRTGFINGHSCQQFVGRLVDKDPMVRRAAFEHLGAATPLFMPILLSEWKSIADKDTHLTHALRIALRDCFKYPDAYQTPSAKDEDYFPQIADISLGIPSPEAAAFVFNYIEKDPQRTPRFDEMLGHVVRHLPADKLPDAFKLIEKLRDRPPLEQRAVLGVVHKSLQARGAAIPAELTEWANSVADSLLSSGRQREVVQGVELAREMRLAAVRDKLQAIAAGDKFQNIRPAAIDACVACDAAGSVKMLGELLARATEPLPIRQKTAQALGSINNEPAHQALAAQLPFVPERLAVDVAVAMSSGPKPAELLITALESGKAPVSVLRNQQVAARLGQLKNEALGERIKKLTENLPPDDDRLRQLVATRSSGFTKSSSDLATGKQVFTKTCATCHKLAGEGAKIGPDLDGIDKRGIERLIEDVLDPNRNVDQAFRATTIETDDGRSQTGLVLREEGQVVVLADNQGKEIRIPADSITSRIVAPLSPMPANVAEQLSEPEFYHLIAFLMSQEKKP